MLLGNNAFCANISGLDFRAFGMKWPGYNNNGKVSDFGVRNYFFIDAVNDNPFYTGTGDQWDLEADVMNWVEIFRFSPWDCWGSNPISNYRYEYGERPPVRVPLPAACLCQIDVSGSGCHSAKGT